MTKTCEAVTQGSMRSTEGYVLPLSRTDVSARIRGPVATVEVRQLFQNNSEKPIEAVYSFPLPHEASVCRMEFHIEDRIVKAIVKEKGEARRDYEKARSEGRSATLLEEDRPSLFTLSVANVPAASSIEVLMEYQEVLGYDAGEWRFAFPMVAPERYQELSADQVAAMLGGWAKGKLRPPRVPTGERPGDIHIEVDLHMSSGVETLHCTTHSIEVTPIDGGGQKVSLSQSEVIPNRDFVLKFRAAGAGVRPSMHFERTAGSQGTFLLVLTPPCEQDQLGSTGGKNELKALKCGNCGAPVSDVSSVKDIPGFGPLVPCKYCDAILAPTTETFARASRPRDVAILFDRSASMRGSLAQARVAVRSLLEKLPPGDAVQVLSFDHDRVAFDGEGSRFMAISPEVISRIDGFLAELTPRGGTELEAALGRVSKLQWRRESTQVVVLVTDAAVGNEGRVLRRAREILGAERRMFVLGLGPSLDRRLLERLARACGGASDMLFPGEEVEAVMARFSLRVREGGPILTGISITLEGCRAEDMYPSPIPDLFGGQPVQLLGRFDVIGVSRLVITGATPDGRAFRQELAIELPAESTETPGLGRLWAKQRTDALINRLELEPGQEPAVREEVLTLALSHALVTRYTSLVAEDCEVVEKGEPDRIEIPSSIAEGGDAIRAGDIGARMPSSVDLMPSGGAVMASYESEAGEAIRDFGTTGELLCPALSAPAPLCCEEVGEEKDYDCYKLVLGKHESRISEPIPRLEGARKKSGKEKPLAKSKAPLLHREEEESRVSPSLVSAQQQRHQIPIEAPGSEQYEPEELRWLSARATGELDLVFLVDETGSMGPYIQEVKLRLLELVAALRQSPLCKSLRLGLVTYRDHPPQDNTYASKAIPLTESIDEVERAVMEMMASGGGDGPESVTDGLFDMVRLNWRPGAAKAVVWFGDAPPHGVSPATDGFPQGCPCGNHWYAQAENCREMGIAVYAVGCLPNLGYYAGAEEVFRIVARTTRANFVPLRESRLLIPLMVGAAFTELDKQRIDERLADAVNAHAEILALTDEGERIRFLTGLLRSEGVRPRSMDYDPDSIAPAPLRFREIDSIDVESSIDRLRLAGRTML